ncbi:MAG: methylmalonyl Co-A mutase-associated GTPase MeaB [Thermomicrobiales bacterium]
MTAQGSPARPGLAARVLQGDRRALARLLTYIENDDEVGLASLDKLYPHTGGAHLIGITGPPGGGKSTLVNEMIRAYRARGKSVAVIAIDPSSPLTGGATLGDRIRMLEWYDDPNVFIRSMASRRFGGGLAQNALAVAHAFDAAGFDPVILETVGTGQDEVGIASLALTTLLVQVPGMGDSIQTLKAGSLEIGDIIVVTKADRPEANDLARDLRRLRTLTLEPVVEHESVWQAPVLKTSAVRQEGTDALLDAIDKHRAWLEMTGNLATRQREIAVAEITTRVQADLQRVAQRQSTLAGGFGGVIDEVIARQMTPHRAASALVSRIAPSGDIDHE